MHHFDEPSPTNSPDVSGEPPTGPWYKELNRYHWFVLIVAALGWLFDCLDQQLFTFTRAQAIRELAGAEPDAEIIKTAGTIVTSIFIIGWATGGLIFGMLGDRIGRAKTMMLTILIYSLFTGLSALSVGIWDFAFYRFLTGLGVGGEFAVGVSLVAEVMPSRARPYALSLLQALSAVGNITAALLTIFFGQLEEQGLFGEYGAWRPLFVVGAAPALLALVIRRNLKEPEAWQAATASGTTAKRLGSYGELFRNPRWRRNAIIGLMLGSVGVIGLWGIGFFLPELERAVLRPVFVAEAATAAQTTGETFDPAALTAEQSKAIDGRLTTWVGIAGLVQNIGAFFGMYAFGILTQRIGRRPAFAIAFIMAGLSTAMVFGYLDELSDIFWMVPLMGFCQLAIFAGYAIYFPELFPTYLRSTGTSFCYNVGRYIAASGPLLLGYLSSSVFSGPDYPGALPWRYAGVTMCLVFVLGLLVLPFAPETKGKPLPE